MQEEKNRSPYYIPSLTFKEIEKTISQNPGIILPVGGMEPVGDYCALGAVNECVDYITNCLSINCGILLQPLLAFSNTTSFRAFQGCSGVKTNIYESVIRNIVKDVASWGTKYIFIIDGTYDSYPVLQKVVQKIRKNKRPSLEVTILNWQHDPVIRSFISERLKGRELGRSEFGIVSMIAYINPAYIKAARGKKKAASLCTEDTYKRWRKLGGDPDKFRKLFPDCSTSVIENAIDPAFGKELCDYIVSHFTKEIKKILNK